MESTIFKSTKSRSVVGPYVSIFLSIGSKNVYVARCNCESICFSLTVTKRAIANRNRIFGAAGECIHFQWEPNAYLGGIFATVNPRRWFENWNESNERYEINCAALTKILISFYRWYEFFQSSIISNEKWVHLKNYSSCRKLKFTTVFRIERIQITTKI